MTIRAVAFDLFGTLVEVFSRGEYDRILNEMAGLLDVDEAAFRHWWMASARQRGDGTFRTGEDNIRWCLEQLGVTRSTAAVDAAAGLRIELCRRWLIPRQDVQPTLADLRDRGLRLALVSNCAPEVAVVWPETGMHTWFDTVILSCSVGLRKPDPAIYRLACQRLGVAPGECLYVGDGDDRELEGAADAGLRPVLIRVPHEDPDDAFRRHDPVWDGLRVAAIGEVPALL